jgi:hypothetical protein
MIQMYAPTKAMFARRELDWRAITAMAYLVDASYVPDLEADTVFPNEPTANAVLASLTLTNLKTTDQGWCSADPMVFVNLTLSRPCGQAVVAAANGGVAVLYLDFPLLPAKSEPDNYMLLFSQRGAGWFRL